MTTFEERISNLSPEKRALLEKYLLEKTSQTRARQTIPRRTSAESYPLSFAQERMWFLEQLYPDSALYNEQSVYRLRGPLNVDALAQSMQIIVQRHEILRTVYRQIEGKPMQIILPAQTVELPVLDLTALSTAEQEVEIDRFAAEESRQPFDLAQGPVYRTKVLRLVEDDHILIQTRHHIATDGWSGGVYWREINELYNAYCQGRTPSLPELPIQYADYALWQRDWLAGEAGERQLAYWRNQLADLSPLELPTDRPRSITQSHRGGSYFFTLPEELTASLKDLGRRENVTLFMILLSAFQVLLHRYSGQSDIAVGSPIANRNRSELEGLIGFFVNTLVLRSNLAGNPSFRSLLNQVRQTCLDAYAHQDLPLEKLVEDLQPERHLDRHPLFQVVFALQNAPKNPLTLEGVLPERLRLPSQSSKFDMTLSITETQSGLQGRFEYSTDLFDSQTIERMVAHFHTLLQGIVADPECPIGRLPMLSPSEIKQCILEWNDTSTDYPADQPLHRLFEAQVAVSPDQVAVVHGAEQWTYAALNQKAEQIAHWLRRLDIGPGQIVALCCERSLEMVAGVVGISKVGAAYLPLDPAYPIERQQLMLADSAASALLTTAAVHPRMGVADLPVLFLDQQMDGVDDADQPLSYSCFSTDHPAYVIYTSGSTGRPKGVMVPQRAILRLVLNTNYITLTQSDVIAQASNFSFDAATFEIWGALLNGARLAILDQDVILSPKTLAEQIREQEITTLFLTTALFNQIARDHPQAFRPLRHLLFGGEAVDPPSVASVLRNGAPAQLLHVYGPTETTTFASWHWIQSLDDGATTVPIGRPLANTQLYVLDVYQQPTPVGIPGELYIGGDGLALGYLNQPEQTRSRFVTVELPIVGTKRLYRTGDRVRYRADGNIEFLGRFDNQVKIRGFRVEPGEIENVLKRHPAIHNATVLVRQDQHGQKQLVAYCVADPAVTAESLHAFLQEKVPAYMIPSAFVMVETLPLNANGKVDYRQLLEMKSPVAETRQFGGEVRDLLDAQMKAVWESLLKVRAIGLDDNFFALGGHSLLAVTLFVEIERLTGKRLPLSILFQSPTLRQLTDAIRSQDWVSPWRSLVAVQPKGDKTPLFLVPPAATTALRFSKLASHLGTDRPIYSFDSLGLDGITKPHSSVEEMAADYIREMRLIQTQGPYLLGGMCLGAHVALEMAQQLLVAGQDTSLLIVMDAGPPVNGPSWRRPVRSRFHYLHRLAHHFKHRTVVNGLLLPKLQIFFRRSAKAINPVTNRIQKVKDIQDEAWRRYIAQPYSGNAVLFQSEMYHKRGYYQRWEEVLLHLVVYVTPGTTHRDMLTTEPYLGQWAAQLRQCLNQVD
jgi:amino acid adenylation domain-containing protein